MADGPLAGVRILDLTHVWAGPLATRVLADLGASVLKVEAPASRGPRQVNIAPIAGWVGAALPAEPWNANAIFVKLQRNKQSLAIDLKAEAGRTTFLELVEVSDVVIENFSARAMPSLGLGYAELAAANPRIIYVSMPGFGMSGPFRDRVAFGPTVEPMSGLTNVMGYGPDEPRTTAMALPDPIAAVNATAAVLTALRRRDDTGEGMLVEMSLHEAAVAYSGPWLIDQQLGGVVESIGNQHPQMAPHGVYRCAGDDAWLALACRDDAEWRALCTVIDGLNADWDLAERRRRANVIDERIQAWTRQYSKESAAGRLQTAGVAAGPVNTTPDMTADPQVLARGFFVPLEASGIPMPGNPIHMGGSSTDSWTPGPKLGADNDAVLRDWLGYTPSRIAALRDQQVLADKPPV